MTLGFGKLQYLHAKFSIFPISLLLRMYFGSSTPVCYNKILLLYCLLSHIYHPDLNW